MDGPIDAKRKIVFASDELPAELDDHARFSLWRDIYTSLYGDAQITRLEDRPFSSRSEFTQIGDIGVIKCDGTFERYARTTRHAAADTRGDFLIGILRGRSRMIAAQRGREVALAPGELALYTNSDAYESRGNDDIVTAGLCMPRARLLERVANADDLVITPLDPSQPAVKHLRRYVEFLLGSDEIAQDPQLSDRISTTLLDLVALSLGASGDVAEIARTRGLRAARLQEVLAEIRVGFANPGFSPGDVASKLGVSPRYVQNLLHETGASFTERVLELRLQTARQMLSSPQCDPMKIGDIAYRCGFNEVPYFNRCFRRRFGASPTQYRGGYSGQ